VSIEKKAWDQSELFFLGDFPDRRWRYDVTGNAAPPRPAVPGGFEGALLGGPQNSHRLAAAGDCKRLAVLLDFVQDAEAFRLEFRRADHSCFHDVILTWSSDQYAVDDKLWTNSETDALKFTIIER
jgi:hypothetical protein